MAIGTIPGVQFLTKTHRCYEYVLDFVIASSSTGSYLDVYHNKPASSFAPHPIDGYPMISFEGQASGRHAEFVPHDILSDVFINNRRNAPIPYISKSSFETIAGVSTGAMATTFEGFAQAMFTRYYENNLDKIKPVLGDRRHGRGPMVLQFAAVVRDAMSHGGTVHMRSNIPRATYFGVPYEPADNGRQVIHNDLTCADIFYLMLDMDLAF